MPGSYRATKLGSAFGSCNCYLGDSSVCIQDFDDTTQNLLAHNAGNIQIYFPKHTPTL